MTALPSPSDESVSIPQGPHPEYNAAQEDAHAAGMKMLQIKKSLAGKLVELTLATESVERLTRETDTLRAMSEQSQATHEAAVSRAIALKPYETTEESLPNHFWPATPESIVTTETDTDNE